MVVRCYAPQFTPVLVIHWSSIFKVVCHTIFISARMYQSQLWNVIVPIFYKRLRKHKGENEWVTWTWQWGLKEKSEKQIKKRRRWSQGREAVNHEEPLKKLKDLFPGAWVLLSSTWLTQTAQLVRGENTEFRTLPWPRAARPRRKEVLCDDTAHNKSNSQANAGSSLAPRVTGRGSKV